MVSTLSRQGNRRCPVQAEVSRVISSQPNKQYTSSRIWVVCGLRLGEGKNQENRTLLRSKWLWCESNRKKREREGERKHKMPQRNCSGHQINGFPNTGVKEYHEEEFQPLTLTVKILMGSGWSSQVRCHYLESGLLRRPYLTRLHSPTSPNVHHHPITWKQERAGALKLNQLSRTSKNCNKITITEMPSLHYEAECRQLREQQVNMLHKVITIFSYGKHNHYFEQKNRRDVYEKMCNQR